MSHLHHSHRYIFAIISCVLFLSAPLFAGDKVEGKRFFELESGGAHYATAHELCAAKAKERHDDKSVDKPYDQLVGERDDGANVWCNLADSNGEKNDQHFGSEGWECPANSERANYGCECADGYESTGKACKKTGSSPAKENADAPYIGNTSPYDPKKSRENIEQAHISNDGKAEDISSTTIAKNANQRVNDNSAKGIEVINCRGNKAVKVKYNDPLTGKSTSANIPYNERDLPIFDDVTVFTAALDRNKNYEEQMSAATQELKAVINNGKYKGKAFTPDQLQDIQKGGSKIGGKSGYTWHHNGDVKNMQLIPSAVHQAVSHLGEGALCNGK